MEIEGANEKESQSVWKTNTLGELCQISAGGDLDKDDFSPYLTNSCVYPIFSNGIENDGLYGYSAVARNEANAITITARGTIGFARFRSDKFTPIGRLLVLYPKSFIDSRYLSYFINDRVRFISETTGVPQLTAPQASNYLVSYPPLKDQQAIAEVLSDADALMASLEKLIEKKKLTFDSLLASLIEIGENATTRSVSLDSGFQIKARIGWQGLTTKEYLEHGNYLLVTGTEFSDGNINWEDCWRVEKERFDQDRNIQLKENDVLITKDGTIGKVAQVNGLKMAATLNSGVFVVRPTAAEILPKYLFYVFRSNLFKSFLNELSAGSTINHLYQKDIVKFKFLVPNSISNQQQKVSVLDEFKLEINLLLQKLKKAKQVKAGLMQELLTGNTRLL